MPVQVEISTKEICGKLVDKGCGLLFDAAFSDTESFMEFVTDKIVGLSMTLLHMTKRERLEYLVIQRSKCIDTMNENIKDIEYDDHNSSDIAKVEKEVHDALKKCSNIDESVANKAVSLKRAYTLIMEDIFDNKEEYTDEEYKEACDYFRLCMDTLSNNIKMFLSHLIVGCLIKHFSSFSKPLHPQSYSMEVGDNPESCSPQP